MKTLIFLLFPLILFAQFPGFGSVNEYAIKYPGLGPNVITNSTFDDDISGATVNAGSGNAAISYETSSPISGSGSLKLTQTTASGAWYRPSVYFADNITMQVGETWEFRVTIASPASGYFKTVEFGYGSNAIAIKQILGTASITYIMRFTLSYADTYGMQLLFDGNTTYTNFTVYIDDVELRKVQ